MYWLSKKHVELRIRNKTSSHRYDGPTPNADLLAILIMDFKNFNIKKDGDFDH